MVQEWWGSEPGQELILVWMDERSPCRGRLGLDWGCQAGATLARLGVAGWGTAVVLGRARAGPRVAGWHTTVQLVPARGCPCSCTELCAETGCLPSQCVP